MVPTMKYWKSLAESSPPAFLYFLNEGMEVVSLWSEVPRKGLVYDEGAASALLRFCMAAAEVRRAGTCLRAHCLAIAAVEVERRDMFAGVEVGRRRGQSGLFALLLS